MRSRRHLAVLWFCVIISLELIIMGGSSLGFAATEVRINCGGGQYTDTSGNVWSADTGYNTGNVASISDAIDNSEDDMLYQSERWDSSSAPEMSYSITVPNGDYLVRLHFAEICSGCAYVGGRVFDVEIEGALVLDNLDIFSEVGFHAALIKTVNVTVSDGQIDIVFGHIVEDPKISAIEILSSGDTSAPSETDSLVVTEEGNVGIGTAQPEAKFHVKGGKIAVSDAGDNTGLAIAGSWIGDHYDGILRIRSGGSTILFDGDDQIGIGQTNPAAKLDVNGKIIMRNQTQDTDSADTVATKGYTDSKIAAAATFPASLTQDGYQKFPSGLIMQWGKVTGSFSGPRVVNFPISFPNAALSISVSYHPGSGDTVLLTHNLNNISVTFVATRYPGGYGTFNNPTIHYIAIGF